MQARAGAVDELIASGALDDASSTNRGDDITRELESMSSQSDVEAELAALKGSAPQAINAPEAGPSRRPPATPPAKTEGQTVEKERAVIVRILGEGQLEVPDDQLDALNALDAPSRTPSTAATRTRSRPRSARCSTAYAASARRSPDDSLEDSDLILPPADATIDEVRDLLSDDGLIPG